MGLREALLYRRAGAVVAIMTCSLALAGQAHVAGSTKQSGISEPRQILVLDSFQFGLPIPDGVNKGLLTALQAGGVALKDIFFEHLDFSREYGPGYRADLAVQLRHRFVGKHIGVVITEGLPAIDFLTVECRDLFPGAAVLSTLSPTIGDLAVGPRKVMNIRWRVRTADTLRAALALFPATRRVFVVTGAHDDILPFLDDARKSFAPWKDRLDFEFANESTYEEMLERISHLPPASIVIYSSYFSDTTGRAFAPIEVVDIVARTADAPVFALLGDFLGHGIVGGVLLKTETIGEQAGRLAIDYLAGRLELAAPVTDFDTPTQAMVDWVELARWKGNLAMLPAGSVVVNRPLTLWGQYKVAVVAAAIAFLSLAAFVGALSAMNRRLSRLRAAASESEARFRVMIERAPESIIVYDADERRIVDANLGAEKLFGCSRERLLEGGLDRFYLPGQPDGLEVAASMKTHDSRALAGEEVIFERAVRSEDGKGMTCEIRLVRLPSRDRRLVRASIIDITERVRAEEVLANSERKYRILAENLPQMIFVKDRDSVYLSCNGRYATALGIRPDDIVGKDDVAFYPRELADKYREDDRSVMKSGIAVDFIEKWPGPGGETWVNTVKSPIWDEKGEVIGVIGIFWDVSERLRLEREQERSLKEKEILLREVNHRVKNNLQLISAMIRLESDGSPNAVIEKFVKDTVSRISSIAIIHEMLYIKDDMAEIAVAQYLREIWRNLAEMYSVPGCIVRVEVDAADLRLDLNRMVPLGLITNEMLTNSLKYAFSGRTSGRISIAMTLDRPSGQYVYVFMDDGIGLPPSFDAIAFKNLGMTFIHSLALQLGGTISMKSGNGLEYELRFPVAG
jgi:PAS domain S-box-containing protein